MSQPWTLLVLCGRLASWDKFCNARHRSYWIAAISPCFRSIVRVISSDTLVDFSTQSALRIGVLDSTTSYDVRESVTIHIHHGNFRLGTAICIVVGNAKCTSLHNGTLAWYHLAYSCRTSTLQIFTSKSCHFSIVIQWIGKEYILFCQSGCTCLGCSKIDVLSLTDPLVHRSLVCTQWSECHRERVNLVVLVFRQFQQWLVNRLCISALRRVINKTSPATVKHTEAKIVILCIESSKHILCYETCRIFQNGNRGWSNSFIRDCCRIAVFKPDVLSCSSCKSQSIGFQDAILDIERLLANECILCLGGQSNLTVDRIVRKGKHWRHNHNCISRSGQVWLALCQGICKCIVVCRNGYRLFDIGRVLISHRRLPTDILPINIWGGWNLKAEVGQFFSILQTDVEWVAIESLISL